MGRNTSRTLITGVLFFFYTVYLIIYCFSDYFAVRAMLGSEISVCILLGGIIMANSITELISEIILDLPRGMVVREVVFIVLLSGLLPLEIAVIAALFSRMWHVALDLALLIYYLYNEQNKYNGKNKIL